jgi:hypothetical protein
VGLNPSDGRYAVSDDRVTHAALGGADRTGNVILYGFTDLPVASLVPLARSWNRPPAIATTAGCDSSGYDQTQRAYCLAATAASMTFTLKGSQESPVCNPCFVVENWDTDAAARVAVNGQAVALGAAFRQGIVRDGAGKQVMIVWLELRSAAPVDLRISRAE